MSKSLYDEAIADAKRLREVAEQNAKNAIIEAVTPRIREFIDKQIVSETTDAGVTADDFLADTVGIKNETVANEDDDVVLDETALKSLAKLFAPKTIVAPVATTAEGDFQQAFDQLSETEKKNLLKLINEKDEQHEEKVTETQEKDMTDETLYEIDLDELKQEIAAAALSPVAAAKKPAPPAPGLKKPASLPQRGVKPVAAMDEIADDEEEGALYEDVLELDLGDVELPEDFMPTVRIVQPDEEDGTEADFDDESVGDELPAPEDEAMVADDESAMEDEGAPAPMDEVFEIDEETLRLELARLREARAKKEKLLVSKKNLKSQPHVKAAARAFGDGDLEEVDEVEINALDTAKKHKLKKIKESRDNRELQNQLNEYRSAVDTLREQMTDLNLFNAKLLYVNKMLQTKELTPKQQKVVIEAIDGAKTLREVKMLYKSLTETLVGGNSSALNESAARFAAGNSSRATTSASARTGEATEVDRWAKLAGLK